MFLRGCLKIVDYLQKAHWKTIANLAFSMSFKKYEVGDVLFNTKDKCEKMYIIMHGLVEIHMECDTEFIIIERLGTGTVINAHNFISEAES